MNRAEALRLGEKELERRRRVAARNKRFQSQFASHWPKIVDAIRKARTSSKRKERMIYNCGSLCIEVWWWNVQGKGGFLLYCISTGWEASIIKKVMRANLPEFDLVGGFRSPPTVRGFNYRAKK